MKTRPNGYIWAAAEQFFNAAEHIWNDETADLNRYLHPIIVNYAFSCELSLKAAEGKVRYSEITASGLLMPVNTESAVRGHDLYDVFSRLKPETQNALTKIFSDKTGEPLIPLLQKCAKYFEHGRYSFEHICPSYSLTDIRCLAKGLLEAVMTFGRNCEQTA